MYNAKYVILGIIILIGVFTAPFWMNLGSPKYERPELALPQGITDCVEPVEYMRTEHMQLLNTWRDEVVRNGRRVYVASNGKEWEISLQNTCMKCHANKADFCDKCHNSNSVSPYCWDCHIAPKGNN